jgi:hypothetical protein
MATSSSELKKKKPSSSASASASSPQSPVDSNKGTPPQALPKNSVVRRLKRAATLAVEEANLRKKQQQPTDETSQNQNQSATASSSASTSISSASTTPASSTLSSSYISGTASSQQQQSTTPKSSAPHNPLPTLRQLTQVIDKRLQHPFGLSLGGIKLGAAGSNVSPSTSAATAYANAAASSSSSSSSANTPPDSMGALYMHNHLHPRIGHDPTVRHVAIVLAKPLQDDSLTVEGAARVKYLLHSILEGKYAPHLVVFCGPVSGPNNRVSDADVSYMYFRNLWECTVHAHRNRFGGGDADDSANGGAGTIALRRPEFYLERMPIDQGGLQQLAQHIQQSYVARWWEEIVADEARQQQSAAASTQAKAAESTKATPVTPATTKRPKPKKLQIHFSLVSSEYQLCQLNDIHVRSPNQSALRAFRSLVRTTTAATSTSSSSASSTRSGSSLLASAPQVEPPTWSFHGVTSWLYSSSLPPSSSDGAAHPSNATTTPSANHQHHNQHPLRAFCAKTYKTAQHMVPVLYNLRGVVEHREFFQRDNYRALVAARRSLITDMERMYHLQPGLRAVHTVPSSGGSSSSSGTAQSLASTSGATKTPSSNPTATYFANMGGVNGQASSASSTGSAGTVRGAGASVRNTNNNDEAGVAHENKPLDVVLESALLSIGRCLDLVRPAGMLTGSVSMDDFKRALSSLQQAYYLLDRACDPDEPLPAEEWTWPLPLEPSLLSTTAARSSASTADSRRAPSSSSWWGAPSAVVGETPLSSSNATFPMTPLR